MRAFLIIAAFAGALAAQPRYDLLLKGGHLIDPRSHISAKRDVAIAGGLIADVAADIPANAALKTVDVSGLYVTPGLVDIHVHVYAGTGAARAYAGDFSVYPDGHTLPNGVTTVVDAGSSGWRNFPDFKQRVIDRSKTRVLAMLNIVGPGMGVGKVEQDIQEMDPKATARRAIQFKDLVVGIKTAHYAGPEWVAVERAVEAAAAANIPVMVDFGQFRPERPFQELVLSKLRPGDIYTHMYLPAVPMFDDQGKLMPYLFEARKRGVIFDVGHGGGSFAFRYAVPAMEQGLPPDSISTDLHVTSMMSGMKDMMNVMSKFLNMGMSLDDVIAKSTWAPAREIHREELGHLTKGAVADVAVLRIANGKFGFVDSYGARMDGTKKLVCELTIRNGKVVWDLNGLTRDDWHTSGISDPRWDGMLSDTVRARK